MKTVLRLLFITCCLLAGSPAWSAVSCSITPNPAQVKPVYTYFANVDVQGSFGVTCTRNPNTDPRRPDIWIGLDQTAAGRNATLETGGSTLNYEIYHRTYGSGTWMNTGNVAATSTTNGGVQDSIDFGNRGSSITETYNFYLRIPNFQFRPAGVYVDTLPVTLRLDNDTGAVLDTATLEVRISIPRNCRFSTAPTGITVNYTAFSASAVTGTSNFAITCTLGTTYTIALDRTRSTVPNVELIYSLSLSATSSTGTAVAQPYSVNISVDAGQPGRCSATSCSGTDTRTITITY